MKNQSFQFHGCPQVAFVHHGPNKRQRGQIFRVFTIQGETVELYISNQGKSIRVWDVKRGRELK